MRFVVLAALLVACGDGDGDKDSTDPTGTDLQEEDGNPTDNDDDSDDEGGNSDDVVDPCASGFEPTGLIIGDEPAYPQTTPTFTWDAADECIASFEIAWGASGVDDLLPWTDVGQEVSAQSTDVYLSLGETYTFSVRAINTNGEASEIVTSEPFSIWSPEDLEGVHLWMDATFGTYRDSQCSVDAEDGDFVTCWASRVGGWYARNTGSEALDADEAANNPDYLYPAGIDDGGSSSVMQPLLNADGWDVGRPTVNFQGRRALLVNDASAIPLNAEWPVLDEVDGLTIVLVDKLTGADIGAAGGQQYPINSERNYEIGYEIGSGNFQTAIETTGAAEGWVWYPGSQTGSWGPSQYVGELYWLGAEDDFRPEGKGASGWRYDGVTNNHYFNGKVARISITPSAHQGDVSNVTSAFEAYFPGDPFPIEEFVESYVMLGGRLGSTFNLNFGFAPVVSYEGEQAELLVFSRALSDDEMGQLNRYLLEKWNMMTAEELEIEQLGEPLPPASNDTLDSGL